jgi:hypothetical protein
MEAVFFFDMMRSRILYFKLPMKFFRLHALGASLVATFATLPAWGTQLELGGGLNLDFNAGADTLAVLQFTDNSTQNIRAGNGVTIDAGGGAIFFGPQQHRLETVLTIGLKYSTMQATQNADLSFVRVPVELLAFYRNDDLHFRVGGGTALYLVNSLSGSGAASNLNATFDPAFAGIVEADFIWKGFFAGLRYTALSLHTPSASVDFAANSIGVSLGYFYHFPGD